MNIKPAESQAIDFLRLFFCIIIVFAHAYTSTLNVAWLSEDKPFYESIAYTCFQWGEVGVLVFFMIAGYFFFYNTSLDFVTYKKKIHSRFQSLVIPYIFWNMLFIALFFVAEQIPFLSQYFTGTNKSVSDYSWLDFLRAFWDRGDWQGGNSTPFDWPLWFVRNLFLLCLLAPVLKIFISYGKIFAILLLVGGWYLSTNMGYLEMSVLFFSLGAYFSIGKKNLIVPGKKYLCGVVAVYLILFFLDFFTLGEPYHLAIHRTNLLAGVFFFLYLTTWCVEKGWIKSYAYYGPLSFFIYVVHNPLINIVRKVTVKLFPEVSDGLSVVLFVADTLLVLGLIFVSFWLLRKYTPKFLRYTVGR